MISIIMPAYNAENTLEFAVRSVLAQTYRDFELIIINDCSKDKTLALANRLQKTDSRIRVLDNERNQGVSLTRRRGVEIAEGDWLAFLDSDDAWMPDKLEKQVALQKRQGQICCLQDLRSSTQRARKSTRSCVYLSISDTGSC